MIHLKILKSERSEFQYCHKEVNFLSFRNFKYFEGSYDSLKNMKISAFGISNSYKRSNILMVHIFCILCRMIKLFENIEFSEVKQFPPLLLHN